VGGRAPVPAVGGAPDRRAAGGSGGGTERTGPVAAIADGALDGVAAFGAGNDDDAGALDAGRGGKGAPAGRGSWDAIGPGDGAFGGTELPGEAPAGAGREMDIGTP
jgi:hypothetical protein